MNPEESILVYFAVQLPLIGAALSLFSFYLSISFLPGRIGMFLTGYSSETLRKSTLKWSATGMAAVSGAALLLYFFYFTEHDLTLYNTAYHSSSDYDVWIRLTSVMWAHTSGILLFSSFAVAAAGAAVFWRKSDSALLLIPFSVVFGLLQMLLVFHPEALPFRSFPVPVLMGAGVPLPDLYWTRAVFFPAVILSFVFFMIYYGSVAGSLLTGTSEKIPESDRLLMVSWVLGALALITVPFYNFQALPGGSLWNWNSDETLTLAYIFSLSSLVYRLRTQKSTDLISVSAAILSFHIGLLFLWSSLSRVSGNTMASLGAGEITGVFTLVHLAGVSVYLILKKNTFYHQASSGSITEKLFSFIFIILSVFLSIAAVYSLIPADCAFYGSELLCSRTEPDTALLTLIAGPLLLSLLIISAVLIAYTGKAGLTLSAAGAAAGLPAALLIWFFLYDPTAKPGIASLLILMLVTASGTVILTDSLIHAFKNRGKDIRYLFYPAFTAGGAVFTVSFTAASLAPSVTEEFHYNLMMQFPESDQVHYYSGDKIYSSGREVQAADLFITGVFTENAYRLNRAKLRVAREAHFFYRSPGNIRFLRAPEEGQSPHSLAHTPPAGTLDSVLYYYFGHHPDSRLTVYTQSFPEISPISGEVITRADQPETLRRRYSSAGRHSLFLNDLTAEIVSLKSPSGALPADLDFLYEYYFYEARLNPEAYYSFFPEALTAEIRFRTMPLLSLVWISSLFLLFLALFYLLTELQHSGQFLRSIISPEENG